MLAELDTERLSLRLFEAEDVPDLHRIFADPETNTIGSGPMTSIHDTLAWVERRQQAFRTHGLAWYAVRRRDSGQLLGNCGLVPGRTGPIEPELGYLITVEARGNGYATETAAAVLAECRRAGPSKIWASVRPGNAASLRIVERLGMQPDHMEIDDKGQLVFYVLDESMVVR